MKPMILNGANIIGADVILKKNQQKIAKIQDIVLNPKKYKIDAFLLADGQSGKVLPFKDAQSITADTVTVESEDVMKSADDVIQKTSEQKKNYMADTHVKDKKDEDYGRMQDVYFDTASGEVTELVVNDNNDNAASEKLIKKEDIVSVGDSSIQVKPQKQKSMSEEKNKKQSKEGIVEKVKATFEKVA